MKRPLLVVLACLGVMGQSVITPLPAPAGVVKMVGLGINSKREVVGWLEDANGRNQAFLGTVGQTRVLLPKGEAHEAFGLNDAGVIVGGYRDQAVVWESASAEPAFLFNGAYHAYGINGKGQIVGDAKVAGGRKAFFLERVGGHEVLLDGYKGSLDSVAYAINDDGMVVGMSGGHAVKWVKGSGGWEVLRLGQNKRSRLAEARAVNANGDVAGMALKGCEHDKVGFYLSGGKVTFLKPMGQCSEAGCVGEARAVSNGGVVYGWSNGVGFRSVRGRPPLGIGGTACSEVTQVLAANGDGVATGVAVCGGAQRAYVYEHRELTK